MRSRDLIQVLHAAESSKSLSFPYGIRADGDPQKGPDFLGPKA